MTVQRGTLPAFELPQEQIAVDEFGGEVIVRGMDMAQQLRFSSLRRRLTSPLDGENAEQAAERAGGELLPFVLSICVVLDDGKPAYPDEQWRIFGARHPDVALSLFNKAMELSGQDAKLEKKS